MPATTLSFPPFTLDVSNACLWREQRRIPLTPKDCAVLHYLVTHAGRLVMQEELLKAVWANTVVGPGVLKVRLRNLRQALRDKADAPRFIETVRGRGYRFIAPITIAPPVARSQYSVARRKTEGSYLIPLSQPQLSGLLRFSISCAGRDN